MDYDLVGTGKYKFSTRKGNCLVGAILLFVSVLFLFFNFIGIGSAAFVSMGLLSGVSPLTAFIACFAAMSGGGVWLLLGLLYILIFLACLVLPILTGVMALVNKHWFSPLWACITGIVHGVIWLIVSIIAMSTASDAMGELSGYVGVTLGGVILPTLWLILYLGCMITPLFLLCKEEEMRQVPRKRVGMEDESLGKTQRGTKVNYQGVMVQVKYTDDSGSHVVKRTIKTNKPLVIGRTVSKSDYSLILEDTRASGKHAELTYDDLNGFVITDLDSTNGVQVNGETIMRSRKISEDDTIRLGDSKLQFRILGSLDALDGEVTQAAGEFYRAPVDVSLRFTDDSGPRVENIVLKDKASIGNQRGCEVFIDSQTVSHKHAFLTNRGNGRISIEDNESTNRVKVNGEFISKSTMIENGDVILLGDVTIHVRIGR